MKNRNSILRIAALVICTFLLLSHCNYLKRDKQKVNYLDKTSITQLSRQIDVIEQSGTFINPRTIDENGEIIYVPIQDWTSGFFPGSLWYAYYLTSDKKWLPFARKYTESLDSVKYLKWHHDIGFMIGCSYLTGYRIKNNPEYLEVIVQAAKSLSTRFQPEAGVIQSWNTDTGWQSKRGWSCPVIIDNMMNLELLFEATRLSGDSIFHEIAVTHANTTLKNHFRKDYSCYHVVDYDKETGEVRNKQTAQGYADETSWARGQAWALYGYVMSYRYTQNPVYLEQAEQIYNFIFSHTSLPDDLIPYWDYDAPNIPHTPRDASAAAITASALYELNKYRPHKAYKETADKILKNLSSGKYKAEPGTNGNFILMHSVGSIPHGQEIDAPINYADYYYLEAIARKKEWEEKR